MLKELKYNALHKSLVVYLAFSSQQDGYCGVPLYSSKEPAPKVHLKMATSRQLEFPVLEHSKAAGWAD